MSIGNYYIRFDLFTNEVVTEILMVDKDEWDLKIKANNEDRLFHTYHWNSKSMITSSTALERHRIAVITSSVTKVYASHCSRHKTEALKQIKSTF